MLSIVNYDKWRLVYNSSIEKDLDENPSCQIHLFDRFNIELKKPLLILLQRAQNNSFSIQHAAKLSLRKKIKQLSSHKNPFGFSVYKFDHCVIVYFGHYGLPGGGRNEAMLTGLALTLGGAVLMASPVGWVVLGGSVIAGAGSAAGLYAFKKEEDEYKYDECCEAAVYGAVGGLAGGVVGAANIGGQALAQGATHSVKVVNGALSSLAANTTQKVLNPNEHLSLRDSVASLAGGGVGGGVSSIMGNFLSKGVGEVSDDIIETVLDKGFEEGFKSGTSSAAATLTVNAVNGRDLKEGLVESIFVGGAIGGVSGSVRELSSKAGTQPSLPVEDGEIQPKESQGPTDPDPIERPEQGPHPDLPEAERKLQELRNAETGTKQLVEGKVNELFKKGFKLEDPQFNGNPEASADQIRNGEQQTFRDKHGNKVSMQVKNGQLIEKYQSKGKWYAKQSGERRTHIGDQKQLKSEQQQAQKRVDLLQKPLQGPQRPPATPPKEPPKFEERQPSQKMSLQQAKIDDCYLYLPLQPREQLENLLEIAQQPPPEPQEPVALQPPPPPALVEYADIEDWFELAKHLVMVHAPPRDLFVDGVDGFERAREDDLHAALYALRGVVSQNGSIANHLNHRDNHYKNAFIDRPHVHWAWNQLVQPHGINNWENGLIAFLEPMESFEKKDERSELYSVSPFDTMSIGPHTLSPQATIIIPEAIADDVRAYLDGFQGRIATYPLGGMSLRQAIAQELERGYPEAWHLIDPANGAKMASQVKRTPLGYMPQTVMERPDGKRIRIIEQEGAREAEILCSALKQAKRMGKGLGLHEHSITNRLERHQFLKSTLRRFIQDPLSVMNKKVFAGYATTESDIKQLGALTALQYHEDQAKMSAGSRACESGDYVLNHTLFADFVSMSLAMNAASGRAETFSIHERALMVSAAKEQLLADLKVIRGLAKQPAGDRHNRFDCAQRLREHFENYKTTLRYHLELMSFAKALLDTPPWEKVRLQHLDHEVVELIAGRNLEAQWQRVVNSPIPEGELQQRWPLTRVEQEYALAVRQLLPGEDLCLHKMLMLLDEALQNGEGIERQRLFFLKHSTQIYLKELYYHSLKHDNNPQAAVRYPYGIQLIDATRVVGNCLFDNIAYQLNPQRSEWELIIESRRLRNSLVEAMRLQQQELMPFFQPGTLPLGTGEERLVYQTFEQYLNALAQDTAWVDELVIRVVAEMIARPILLVKRDQQRIEENAIYNRNGQGDPLYIAHVSGNHFVSCILPEGQTPQNLFQEILQGR